MSEEPYFSAGKNILGGKKVVALDIGGAAGVQPQWGKILGNARCVMFEPHPKSFTELVEMYRTSSHVQDFVFVNKALSGSGGSRTFYHTNCPTGSSMLEPNLESKSLDANNSYFFPYTTSTIETVTLSEALNHADITDVDMMKLDIQGAELEVIKGLGQDRLASCLFLESEVGLLDIYKNSTTFPDLNAYLTEHGFELLDIRCNRYPKVVPGSSNFQTYNEKYFNLKPSDPSIAARVYEFDVVYAKDPTQFLEKKDERKLRNLIFAYCVYNFFGEAMHILELGLMNGTFDQNTANEIGNQVALWHSGIKRSVAKFEGLLEQNNNMLWGQYVWVPYPCS